MTKKENNRKEKIKKETANLVSPPIYEEFLQTSFVLFLISIFDIVSKIFTNIEKLVNAKRGDIKRAATIAVFAFFVYSLFLSVLPGNESVLCFVNGLNECTGADGDVSSTACITYAYGACNGGSGWNIGGDSTSGNCCADDTSVEWETHRVVYTTDPANTWYIDWAASAADDACCNAVGDCVYGSYCYTSSTRVDTGLTTSDDRYAACWASGTGWLDCDGDASRCGHCSLSWLTAGESNVGEYSVQGHSNPSCCGDDFGTYDEYSRTESQGTDASSQFDDAANLCCNAAADCVDGSTCYTTGAVTGTGTLDGYCNGASGWQGGDAGQTQCEALSDTWLANGVGQQCCGDDGTADDFEQTSTAGRACCLDGGSLADGSSSGAFICSDGQIYSCDSSGTFAWDDDYTSGSSCTAVEGKYCDSGAWVTTYADGCACTADAQCSNWCDAENTANEGLSGSEGDDLLCFSAASCTSGTNCGSEDGDCQVNAGADAACDDYSDSGCAASTGYCDATCAFDSEGDSNANVCTCLGDNYLASGTGGQNSKCCGDDGANDDFASGTNAVSGCCNGGALSDDNFCNGGASYYFWQVDGAYCSSEVYDSGSTSGTTISGDDITCGCDATGADSTAPNICDGTADSSAFATGVCVDNDGDGVGTVFSCDTGEICDDGTYFADSCGDCANLAACDSNVNSGGTTPTYVQDGICVNEGNCDTVDVCFDGGSTYYGSMASCSEADACDGDVEPGYSADGVVYNNGGGNLCCNAGEDYEGSSSGDCCYNNAILVNDTASGSVFCFDNQLYDCNSAGGALSPAVEDESSTCTYVGSYWCGTDDAWTSDQGTSGCIYVVDDDEAGEDTYRDTGWDYYASTNDNICTDGGAGDYGDYCDNTSWTGDRGVCAAGGSGGICANLNDVFIIDDESSYAADLWDVGSLYYSANPGGDQDGQFCTGYMLTAIDIPTFCADQDSAAWGATGENDCADVVDDDSDGWTDEFFRWDESEADCVECSDTFHLQATAGFTLVEGSKTGVLCESACGANSTSDEKTKNSCDGTSGYVNASCHYFNEGDSNTETCSCVTDQTGGDAGIEWDIGGEIATSECCGDDAGEYDFDATYDASLDDSPAVTDACCDADSDCVFSNTCYATGYVSTDVDSDGDNDYCNSGSWYDCDTDSECAEGYSCVANDCVDNIAPTCVISDITQQINIGYQHVDGTTKIYYNNYTTGTFNITVTSTDAGTGVHNVTFPDTVDTGDADTSSPYTQVYAWVSADNYNDTATVTCYDVEGNSATDTFKVILDINDSIDGTVSYTDSYTASSSITFTDGTDNSNVDSGINASRTRLLRSTATVKDDNTCDIFGSWSQIGSLDPTSPYSDTLTGVNCYMFRYEVYDNVSNVVNFTSSDELIYNNIPTHDTPTISPGSPTTNNNITCVWTNVADTDGDVITNITNWYKNNVSTTLLYMPFEGNGGFESTNTTDYSGYGNNGTVFGATFNRTGGKVGGGYEFDGIVDEPIVIQDDISLDITGQISIEAWIKPKSTGLDWEIILFKGADKNVGSDQYSYILRLISTGLPQFGLNISEYGSDTVSGDSSLINNTWYYLVGTYNGTTMSLYVNGQINNSKSRSGDITIDSQDLYIGGFSDDEFNGTIDEVKIYNRSLSPEQIWANYNAGLAGLNSNILVNNETAFGNDYLCSVTPNDGYQDGTTKNSTAKSLTNIVPAVTAPAFTPTTVVTTDNINCNATPTDFENTTLSVEWYWYNSSDLKLSGNKTDLTNGVNSIITTLGFGNTSKGETWNCTLRTYDGFDFSISNSSTITLGNSAPSIPTLLNPSEGNTTYHDRSPLFNWSSSDEDGDSINYTINITFSSTVTCGVDYLTNITANVSIYTATKDYCVDEMIFWQVRAFDGTDTSAWSELWNFTIESFISLDLTTNSADFGSMNILESKNTEDDGIPPLIVENTGNIMVNISKIGANASLFDMVGLNTIYFQFKANNVSTEGGAFNVSNSTTTWTNITSIAIANRTIIKHLDYNDSKDNAEIDIKIIVPLDESIGTKKAAIYIVGELGEA